MSNSIRDYILLVEGRQPNQLLKENVAQFKRMFASPSVASTARAFMRSSKIPFSRTLLTRIVDQTDDAWGGEISFFENCNIFLRPYLQTIENALEERGMGGLDVIDDEDGSLNPDSFMQYLRKLDFNDMMDVQKRAVGYVVPVICVLAELASGQITFEQVVSKYGTTEHHPFT